MDIKVIERELKIGQVHPGRLAQMKDYLAAYSSSLMDRQLELQMLYASWFTQHRSKFKSDKATLLDWRTSAQGAEELQLEVTQKKIKLLREAISSHLRVADNQARNLY